MFISDLLVQSGKRQSALGTKSRIKGKTHNGDRKVRNTMLGKTTDQIQTCNCIPTGVFQTFSGLIRRYVCR